jgi:hypothetical protein
MTLLVKKTMFEINGVDAGARHCACECQAQRAGMSNDANSREGDGRQGQRRQLPNVIPNLGVGQKVVEARASAIVMRCVAAGGGHCR